MNIYLIRHAQSINNHLWEIHGSDEMRVEDPELSDLGCLQARLLASFLARRRLEIDQDIDFRDINGYFLTHLYVSPMVRAVATGVEIGKQLGIVPEMNLEIYEGGGIYLTNPKTGEREGLRGKNRAFYEEHFPDLILPETLGQTGWWSRPFEARELRRPRARRVLDGLLSRHAGKEDHVALVTHVGFYNHLMRVLFEVSEEARVWFRLDNAAMTRIMIDEQEIRLVYANRLDYLPQEMIT